MALVVRVRKRWLQGYESKKEDPAPWPVAIGRRSIPNPHLDKAGELALVEPVQKSDQTDPT